jgi:hypothetical protein
MALNEVQLPSKVDIYRDVQSISGEILSRSLRWGVFADFLNTMTVEDATAVGIPTDVLTLMGQMRTSLNTIVTAIEDNSAEFEALRKPLII